MALPTLQLTWRKEGGSSLVRLFYKRAPISFWGALLSVQFSCSVVSNSLRPHVLQHARPPCPSPTPEFTQTHVHWVGDAIQPSHPLSFLSPPAFNLSQHQGLSKESVLHIRWSKYWSFSFNISPSNEHPGPISLLKINENIYPHKDFYLNLQCSTKHNSPKLETIQTICDISIQWNITQQ